METVMTVNQVEYSILKLLGHGKGGYSYLAERDGKQFVLKQIHHEPCAYYTFGNKIEARRMIIKDCWRPEYGFQRCLLLIWNRNGF